MSPAAPTALLRRLTARVLLAALGLVLGFTPSALAGVTFSPSVSTGLRAAPGSTLTHTVDVFTDAGTSIDSFRFAPGTGIDGVSLASCGFLANPCRLTFTIRIASGVTTWGVDLLFLLNVFDPVSGRTFLSTSVLRLGGPVEDHHLSQSLIDLGEIPLGSRTDLSIDLFNDRSSPLEFGRPDQIVTTDPLQLRSGDTTPFAVGASRTYAFGVRPSVAGNGSATATFNFADGTSPKSRTLTVQWTAVGPQIAADPALLQFDPVPLGASQTKVLKLKNTGNRPLTLTNPRIDIGGDTFSLLDPIPSTIEGGASIDVRVRCKPAATGDVAGRIIMGTNDPARPTYAPQLRCTGVPIALTVGALTFPGTTLASATATFRVTNASTSPITITGYSADSALRLPELDAAPKTIAPGGTLDLGATWRPTDVRQSAPTLTLKTSVGDYAVETSGTSGGAKLVMTAEINRAPGTDFGDVALGDAARADVVVRNAGTVTTTLDSFTFSSSVRGPMSADTVGPLTAGRTVLPGQIIRVTVSYRPTAPGTNSGTLSYVASNTTVYNRAGSLTFTGRAVGSRAGASTTSLDYGEEPLGSTTDRQVTITNTGNQPLAFAAPLITGAGFSLVAPDTSPVPVGGSRAFTVRFAPKTPGAATGSLTLPDNAYGADVTVSLSGSGVGPVATIDEAPLTTDKVVFPETAIGKSRTRAVTVRNTGNAPLVVSSFSINALFTSAAFTATDEIVDIPLTLAPGESHTVTVRYAPTRVGLQSGTLALVTNDPQLSAGVRFVNLSGSGYQPGVAVADPDRLDFGAVDIDTSAALSLTVRNSGPRAFTITGVTTPDGSQLSVDGLTTPVNVNPSTGRGFTVRWSPTRDADLTGDLIVATSEGELKVPLSGTVTTDRLFEKARPADTGSQRPTQVALGDLDRDGRLDLVTGYAATGRVGVALGLGTGQFGATTFLDAASGAGSLGLALADLDGDGALDIITGRSVYLGAGDGTFGAGASTGISGEDVAVGDIDANGVPDVVVTSLADGVVRLALGLGDGTFEVPTDLGTVAQPGSPVLADVNRDGRLDLIVGGRGSDQQVAVFINSGTGRLLEARYDTPSSTPYALAVGDLNNDQRPDISAAHSWLAGKADGTFAPAADGSVASDDLGIADFDGDGFDDQVVAGKDSPVIFVSRGLGDGTFTAPDEYDVGTTGGDELADLATGDLNGDGRVDIVAAKGGTRVDVLMNRQGIVEPGAGKALISELRFGGAGYVQVQNASRTSPLRLDGWQLVFSSGERVALHTGSALQPGGTLLVSQPTNDGWPFGDLARSVLTLPGTGLNGVRLVDALGEPVDAAGFDDAAAAYREGTAITSVSGSTGLTYLRRFSNGARVDTDDNAADFVAVDPEATEESGLLLGSPRPDGLTAPTNRNDILSTSLVDPSVAQSAAPNRVIGGGKLTINRTITNCIGQPKSGVCANADTTAPGDTVTKLRLRITELSTIGNSQVGGAILKVVGSEDATYGAIKVNGLELDAPTPASGGGINATLTATLPGAGLGPGESINVAITFLTVRAGAYRIGYDAEDDLIAAPKAGTPTTPATPTPSSTPAAPAVIDPAPAPAAPAIADVASGTVSQAPLAAPAPAGTPAPTAGAGKPTATKKRCVTRAKYRKLTKQQRRTARICAPAKRSPTTPTTTPKTKATR